MHWRRPKEEALRSQRWKQFLRNERAAIVGVGIPEAVLESEQGFGHFMEHGFDHDASFVLDWNKLPASGREAVRELVRATIRAGVCNFGVDILPHEEMVRIWREFDARR